MNDQSLGAASNGLFQPEVKRAAPRELLFRDLRYLPWVVICAALAFVLGYINIRYAVPVFQVQSSLLIKNDDQMQGDKDDRLGQLFMPLPGTNLNNEIHLLRSTQGPAAGGQGSGLQTTYYNKGKVRRSSLLYKNLPFQLLVLELPDSNNAIGFDIKVLNDKEFLLNEGKERYFR